MSENNEEKNVYKERPDLVEALKGQYFCPFETVPDGDGGTFAEIKSISEVVGERAVKLIMRKVSVLWRPTTYGAITFETDFPWWTFKKHVDDELTADMVVSKMTKLDREELAEFARKTLNKSLQVLGEMGITKAELLR